LEPAARYARPVIPLKGPANVNRARYELTDLKSGFSANLDHFYELNYQPILRAMAAVVIRTEGPIFMELLVTRIARAHGFGRRSASRYVKPSWPQSIQYFQPVGKGR
jgi:hypothetical protein